MIGKTISHYLIIEKLGEGGMGVVYKAEDTKLDRIVALKFLSPHLLGSEEEKTRFIHEAKAAASLNHTNICTIHEIDETKPASGEPGGQTFIAMEYIEGQSLKDKITERPLKLDEALDITIQIATGLQKAHEKQIIHRDIKPANILLSNDGVAKIVDFGLAKLAGHTKLTKTDSRLGTVAYMSPEQIRGDHVNQRTDIWSLGVVLYEMLTSQLPFKGDYEQAMVYNIVNEEPDLSKITELNRSFELISIVKNALEKKKDNRYSNMKNLIDDLSSFKENLDLKSSVESDQDVLVPSIAVLPFVDMSPESDQEYFCNGIAEEIITSLSHLEKLKVVARTSAFAFKGKQMDVREIGQKLGVDHILEGSIRKAGNRLRITAQLIQVCDGFYLWSDRFDRVLEDVFSIQDEISLAIADNLKVKLFAADRAIVTKSYTVDIDAYNDYLMGRYFVDKGRKSDFLKGIEYFTKAIEADPNYAQGYSGIANAYYLLGLLGSEMPSKVFPKAKEYAEKALQADDTISEAHTILGLVKVHYDWDWEGAEKEFQLALSLNPNSSFTYYGFAIYYGAIGKAEEAITHAKKYLELDPLSIFAYNAMGTILLRAGHYKMATKHFQKVMEMDPNLSTTYFLSGQVDMKQSFYDQGIALIERAADLENDNPLILSSLGWAYGIAGRKKEAKQILVRLQGMSRDRYISRFLYAKIYAGLGDKDQAFKYLEEAYQQHAMSLALIITDESVENLRSDPRFMKLLKKINLDNYFSL